MSPSPRAETALTRFLAGSGTDSRGRTLEQILGWADAELERRHDYIQWLFPLPTPSGAVPGAPVMTEAERAVIAGEAQSRRNIEAAAGRMRAFYAAGGAWLTPYDHNHLRITRIITSLGLLLGPEAAASFHDFVEQRLADSGAAVNPQSRAFWRRARETAR